MEIKEFLNPKAVSVDLQSQDKKGVIKEMLGMLAKAGAVKNESKLFDVLMNREALGSTGIGQGVGIPHGKTSSIKNIVAAFGISKGGVNFESLDGESTHIFFLILAPENSAGPHLKALARISRLLKDKFFRERLMQAKTPKDTLDIIIKEDQAKR